MGDHHLIEDDGYNLGRDFVAERAAAGGRWQNMWWRAEVDWNTELLEPGWEGEYLVYINLNWHNRRLAHCSPRCEPQHLSGWPGRDPHRSQSMMNGRTRKYLNYGHSALVFDHLFCCYLNFICSSLIFAFVLRLSRSFCNCKFILACDRYSLRSFHWARLSDEKADLFSACISGLEISQRLRNSI